MGVGVLIGATVLIAVVTIIVIVGVSAFGRGFHE